MYKRIGTEKGKSERSPMQDAHHVRYITCYKPPADVKNILIATARKLGYEYAEQKLIRPDTKVNALGAIRSDGYTIWCCSVYTETYESGYRICLEDLPPSSETWLTRQMRLGKKKKQQFLDAVNVAAH